MCVHFPPKCQYEHFKLFVFVNLIDKKWDFYFFYLFNRYFGAPAIGLAQPTFWGEADSWPLWSYILVHMWDGGMERRNVGSEKRKE